MRITIRPEGLARPGRLAALGLDLRLATVRALNRTVSTVRTATSRALAQDTGLPQKLIRPRLAVERATFTRQQATLSITGRRLPLIAFGARQTRTGVTYRLPGGRGRAPHAFLSTMRSGHLGVFQRRGLPRLPIVELFGPSLPQVIRKHLPDLRRVGEAALQTNLAHEIDFLLRGRGGSPAEGADAGTAS